MSKLLVVVGITGQQGGSVAEYFSHLPGWKIRGLTRSSNSASALSWISRGVSIVAADLNKPSTLDFVFAGATTIFGVTDFWASFYNSATTSLLKEGQTMNEYCYEQELQQMKNIADAAAKVEGVERLVIGSMVYAQKWSGGDYSWVFHFDSKARGVQYLRESYPELEKKLNVVFLGAYMENWRNGVRFDKRNNKYHLSLPFSGHNPMPHFSVQETGKVVHVILSSVPGTTILASGSSISWTEYLKIWCRVQNVAFGGVDTLAVEDYARFIPVEGLGREIGEMLEFVDRFGYCGGGRVVGVEELAVECKLTSWEEFVRKEDWSTLGEL